MYEYVQFNGDDDVIDIEVTAPGTALGAPVMATLSSTTGGAQVGTITVDPGSGPIGTVHTVTVDVGCPEIGVGECDADEYEDRVARADLETTAEGRGTFAFDLEQDSADAGLWVRDFTSYGDEGETRSDAFRVVLYELVEVPPEANIAP